MVIEVVVAALETRVDRAPGPIGLAVVVDPFITANKCRAITTQATSSGRRTHTLHIANVATKTRTLENLLLQA